MTIQMNGMMMRRMIMKINNLILLPLLLITPAVCASEYDDENYALFDGYLPPSPLPNVDHAPEETASVYPAQEQCSALHQSAKRAADVQKFLKKLQSSENLQPCAAAAISNSKSQKKKKSFACTICNISFPNASRLSRHNLIHNNEKKYVCEVCHKPFGYISHLKTHMRIHTDEKPFVCDYIQLNGQLCGKACRKQSDLTKHKLIHENKKAFTCTLCNVSCNQKLGLTIHKKSKKHCKAVAEQMGKTATDNPQTKIGNDQDDILEEQEEDDYEDQ